ncbi:MAG: glycoside hydrolase family 5 protein [Oceanipulchritudo sp.]
MNSTEENPAFLPARGVNISHWLSQRKVAEPRPPSWFSEVDTGFLHDLGFDHIRLPVDEEILWDERGARREEEWDRLHHALQWCHRHALRVIVDLHIIRAHHFNAGNQGKSNPLWTSESARDGLIHLWDLLSDELREYPESEVAYEFMNEPVAPDPEDWNRLLERVHASIRRREPTRVLVIGSNLWQKVKTVPQLRIPRGDPNLLVSFHYYEPGPVTHYRSSWTPLKEYDGPVRYPGVPFPAETLPADPSPGLRKLLEESNRPYDREVIREEVRAAVEFAREHGLRAHCGEWGCHLATPAEVRYRWYEDVVGVFTELGVAWTIWDYKGGFRIVDPTTQEADQTLLGILLEAAST